MTSTELVVAEQPDSLTEIEGSDYITMIIAGQFFGLPVVSVHDVLGPQKIAHIPLAPPEVAGSLNLRGRIVTAIDMRTRLGLPPRAQGEEGMSVVAESNGELYSLIIDTVGEVLSLPYDRFEQNPSTLDARWRAVAGGIFRLDERLLVVLDVDRVLDFGVSSSN
jgi:purine-binding chemotaxis protein CheW